MKKTKFAGVVAGAAAAVVLVAGTAVAAVTFDAETGSGFVGKGDVQLALGLNNKQIQNTAVEFTYEGSTTTATTWTCDRDAGPQTQERNNTTTTTIQGVVSKVARENSKGKDGAITGYHLLGFDGSSSTETESDGPAVESCPTGWTAIDLVVGDPVVTGGGLLVNGVPLQ